MFKRDPEQPNKLYVNLLFVTLIFEEGKYVGFYHPNLKKVP